MRLTARGVSRRFGGLLAVADVSVELEPGRPHAVIGPNGAGKSTLVNLLFGTLRPDEGTILLDGNDITALADWRRSRAGIGRSFQRVNLFPPLTVFENVRLAAQGGLGLKELWQSAGMYGDVRDRATAALDDTGIAPLALHEARTLSHGQRRLLEIALVLATAPGVLLLDEPLAGLGAEETGPVVGLLRSLAARHAMLLVEHDMDVVFAVADEITVMVDGRVLESGTSHAIRRSDAVRDAYLGRRA